MSTTAVTIASTSAVADVRSTPSDILVVFLKSLAMQYPLELAQYTFRVTTYFPGTVGVNLSVERSKLLLVSNVSVLHVKTVSVSAVTV